MKRLTAGDFAGIKWPYVNFAIEYSKDFDAVRAAKASGFSETSAYATRDRDEVQTALKMILQHRLDSSHIDAEWLKQELVDNHYLARQMGNINASNTALKTLGMHAAIDAFAAEKVHIDVAENVIDRLQRGRKRAAEHRKKPAANDGPGNSNVVSFIKEGTGS